MAKLASQNTIVSPTPVRDSNNLHDLQVQHERALSKYDDTRARLAQASSKSVVNQERVPVTVTGKSPDIATVRQRHLEAHLENLRLQKRHANLQVLSRCSEEAEEIVSGDNIFDNLDLAARTTVHAKDSDQQAALGVAQRQLETLNASAKLETTNLELALVTARQKLKLEQILLERVKRRGQESRNGEEDSRTVLAKHRAMEATRNELQKWIGECLVRCEQEVPFPQGAESPSVLALDAEHFEEADDSWIEAEYERYLEARIQLVHAAIALKMPLPQRAVDPSSIPISQSQTKQIIMPDDQKQRLTLQRAPHLRHKSHISVNKFGEQPVGASLSQIEGILLPKYHHERLLNAYTGHLDSQTISQDLRLVQSLNLLSHESILLPSYPLSMLEEVHGDQAGELSQQQAEIEHLLQAWAFASETADEVLRENVIGNMEETREALEKARQHLEEIHIMEDMRKRVASGRM